MTLLLSGPLVGCSGPGMKMSAHRYAGGTESISLEASAPTVPGIEIESITPQLIARLRTQREEAIAGRAAPAVAAMPALEPTAGISQGVRRVRVHLAREVARVRARPTVQSVQRGRIETGRAVMVRRRAADSRWFEVQWKDQTGYVHGDLLEAREVPAERVYLALENARVRQGPGTHTAQLGSLTRGGVVIARPGMSDPRWVEVDWSGNTGFVSRSLLRPLEAQAPPSSAVQADAGYRYRVGAGDVLGISLWDRPELGVLGGESGSAETASRHLVSETGTIFYPNVGVVGVAGKSIAEIRELLTSELSRTIQAPQLDLRVANFRSQKVYVVGEVATPGLQPITDAPLTVVDAINQAGGVSSQADTTNVSLVRNGTVVAIDLLALYENGDVRQNVLLADGDLLHVPDSNDQKVFVLGEVMQPSSRLMNKGRMSLAEAIGDVGGVNPVTSNPSRIYVIRGSKENPGIYHMNARSPDALILADQFALRPRDVVYVETAELSRWARIIGQILPAAQTLNQFSSADFPLFKGKQGSNSTR